MPYCYSIDQAIAPEFKKKAQEVSQIGPHIWNKECQSLFDGFLNIEENASLLKNQM